MIRYRLLRDICLYVVPASAGPPKGGTTNSRIAGPVTLTHNMLNSNCQMPNLGMDLNSCSRCD